MFTQILKINHKLSRTANKGFGASLAHAGLASSYYFIAKENEEINMVLFEIK